MATKIWASTVEEGRAQYAAQQRFFGRVEIEQIHNLTAWRDQLRWLREEREAGRIDRLGVTHYSARHFGELEQALQTGLFDTVQVPLNPRRARVRAADPATRGGARAGGDRDAPARRHRRAAAPSAHRTLRSLEPLRPFGVETWAQALLEVVPRRPSRRPRHPRDVAAGRARSRTPRGLAARAGPEERRLVERLAGG